MLPALSAMIYFYIVARLIDTITLEQTKTFTKVASCAAILGGLVSLIDIFNAASHASGLQ